MITGIHINKSILLLFIFSLVLTACIPINSIFLAMPDDKDLQRSPAHLIQAGENCYQFSKHSDFEVSRLKVNDWTEDIPFFVDIPQFLQTHQVRSFLILRRDTLLYEYYAQDLSANSIHPSYSIAKSFTSVLVGIAIDEGHIQSEEDLVISYLPELKTYTTDERLNQLKIKHLLNHTSGIHYRLETDAKIYYGRNLMRGIKGLKFDHQPGTYQHYLNINIQLLGLVLQNATQKQPSAYLEEKIWKPLGMCNDAIWSTDRKDELEKTYCCLGATALDYAKFGRLFLKKGVWEDKRIVSEAWYNKSIARDTSEGSSFNYNYSWYIGLKEYGDFMAIGLYKQHIYVHPKKEIIIISLNDREKPLKAERVNWWHIFRQLVDQL